MAATPPSASPAPSPSPPFLIWRVSWSSLASPPHAAAYPGLTSPEDPALSDLPASGPARRTHSPQQHGHLPTRPIGSLTFPWLQAPLHKVLPLGGCTLSPTISTSFPVGLFALLSLSPRFHCLLVLAGNSGPGPPWMGSEHPALRPWPCIPCYFPSPLPTNNRIKS